MARYLVKHRDNFTFTRGKMEIPPRKIWILTFTLAGWTEARIVKDHTWEHMPYQYKISKCSPQRCELQNFRLRATEWNSSHKKQIPSAITRNSVNCFPGPVAHLEDRIRSSDYSFLTQ